MVQYVITELGEHNETIGILQIGPINHRVQLKNAPVQI